MNSILIIGLKIYIARLIISDKKVGVVQPLLEINSALPISRVLFGWSLFSCAFTEKLQWKLRITSSWEHAVQEKNKNKTVFLLPAGVLVSVLLLLLNSNLRRHPLDFSSYQMILFVLSPGHFNPYNLKQYTKCSQTVYRPELSYLHNYRPPRHIFQPWRNLNLTNLLLLVTLEELTSFLYCRCGEIDSKLVIDCSLCTQVSMESWTLRSQGSPNPWIIWHWSTQRWCFRK